MINNEVKSILEQQFSMERNYERIIKKAEKKENLGFKITKIALIPICIILLAILIIPKENNEKLETIPYRQVVEIAVKEKNKQYDMYDREYNLDKMTEMDTDNQENISIIKVKIIEENKKAEIIEYIKANDVDLEVNKIYIENSKLEEGKEYILYIDKVTYEIVNIIE